MFGAVILRVQKVYLWAFRGRGKTRGEGRIKVAQNSTPAALRQREKVARHARRKDPGGSHWITLGTKFSAAYLPRLLSASDLLTVRE
jgi:hypothetical protein